MKIEKYQRKPFIVDAVLVTEDNFFEVAKWCKGDAVYAQDASVEMDTHKYIRVKVFRPLNDKQTKAYIGDWILHRDGSFKVFTDKALQNSFEPVFKEETRNVFENTASAFYGPGMGAEEKY